MAPRNPRVLFSALVALGSFAFGACADTPDIDVKYASDFAHAKTSVSVLGIFRGGRMSPEAWTYFGSRISSAFGRSTCEVGYGDALQSANQDLYSSIDAKVRSDGITEDLLDELAPRAQGEMILTLSIHGRVKVNGSSDGEAPAKTPRRQAPPPRPGRGARRAATALPPGGGDNDLEISAMLFSVKAHQAVARWHLRYAGSDVDEAVRKLAADLGAAVPGSTCVGWRWEQADGAAPVPIPE